MSSFILHAASPCRIIVGQYPPNNNNLISLNRRTNINSKTDRRDRLNNWMTDYEMLRKSANDREISNNQIDKKTERILASLNMTKIWPEKFQSAAQTMCKRKGVN